MKPIMCNEKVTIERRVAPDPTYGTPTDTWEVVASRYWANLQDELPSRGESVTNGLRTNVQRTRLRMRKNPAITTEMRVTLHSRDDRKMQIISGPALLDDRIHCEWMLEGYSSDG